MPARYLGDPPRNRPGGGKRPSRRTIKENRMSKWNRAYFVDLAERVGTTAIYGIVAMLTADQSGFVVGTPEQWWVVVGLPTVLALLKGLLANMADGNSGASVVPAPPGPVVVDPEQMPVTQGHGQRRDDRGESALYYIVAVIALLVLLWLALTVIRAL